MNTLMNWLILVFVIVILFSLASAIFYLVRDGKRSESAVKALTWRISLSLGLFVLLLIAMLMGWIQPHGLIN